jgi:hypothetical protein
MRITISWVNRNAFAEGHRVYRSTAPIDTNALPAPIATLAAAAATYHDTTVVRGETYYYRIGTYKGSEMVFTANMKAIALPNTGPGPKDLVAGDFNAGYFGILEAHQLVSGPELKTLLGHTLTAGATGQRWAKVAHQGKILFVPIGYQFGFHTWQQLYAQGLVYGTDSVGPAEAVAANGGVGVNQLKTFSKDNFTYKVRLLKGLPEGPYSWNGSETVNPDFGDSEFNQVMLRLAYGIYGNEMVGNLTGLTPSTLTYSQTNYAATLCQDIHTNGKAVIRALRRYNSGYAGSSLYYYWYDDIMGGATTVATNASSVNAFSHTAYTVWRPILELVPPEPVTEPEPETPPAGSNPDGAGSTVLAAGDVQLGYYETLAVESLVSGTELASLVGLTAGDPIVANDDVNWIKYSFEGKTRYVAQKPIRNNLSADELIAAGLTGDVETTVIIGDSTYRVTLMEGANPTLTEYTGAGNDTESTHNSEWNQVMYRLYSGSDTIASEEPLTPWAALTNADLDTNYYCFTRGKVFGRPANTMIARGYGTVSHIASLLNESKVPANAWRPVLELVVPEA